jgi:C1A family cysteine protease
MIFAALLASIVSAHVSFDRWIYKHNKSYSSGEYIYRQSIWQKNLLKVEKHNMGNSTYTLKMNKFADLTFDEFKNIYLMKRKINVNSYQTIKTNVLNIPINWNIQGYVQEVNDQMRCGSCWAFSAAETLAARFAIVNKKVAPILSPQEMVDCIPEPYAYGCDGAFPNITMQYVLDRLGGGLEEWDNYPYVGIKQFCDRNKTNTTVNVNGTKVRTVEIGNQTDFLQALYKYGPISVCMNVEGDFMLYNGGVYTNTDCSLTELDHAIIIYGVHYDIVSKRWVYLARNSWGLDVADHQNGWGVSGDVWLDAEINNGGICGVLGSASYVM